jgi:ABC-2 type transport system ATP-binding protein
VRLATPDPDRIATLPGVAASVPDGDGVAFSVHDSDAFVRALVASGLPFSQLQVRGATLEEAFLALTERSAA